MTQAFPLHWPEGWPRTEAHKRERARFDTSWNNACYGIIHEIRLLDGRYPIISSDFELRRDGLPYANQRIPDDPGIAVYFELDGEQRCIPCDRWIQPRDNIQAIKKTIEAMRGINRWGTGEMMKRTFQAFGALPPPDGSAQVGVTVVDWWRVLGVAKEAPFEVIKAAYRALARTTHPDTGGNIDDVHKIKTAFETAKKESS